MARIWNLRLNIDELNAVFGMAFSDSDRSDTLIGLFLGCNGGEIPEGSSKVVRRGFEVGSAWRLEAEAHQERMSMGGRASAESRRAKAGTAQPSKVVRSTFEGSSNQSTIYNPQSKEVPPTPKGKAARKVKDQPIPIPDNLLPFLEELQASWPRRNHDGKRVTILRPVDMWDKICKNRQTDDPRVCINAGLFYLEGKPTSYIIGMDNFFGQARKYTKYVVED